MLAAPVGKRQLPFLKMHGLGNDFVIIDGRDNGFKPSKKFLTSVSNRKRGIGCDQFVFLRKPQSPDVDVFLEMYNADGGAVNTCGNATRCVASLMFKELGRKNCVIKTTAGILKAWEDSSGLVAVDFGMPRLEWQQIPLAHQSDTLRVPVSYGGYTDPCCINVGNPHAVFFTPDVASVPLAEVGPHLEYDPNFPERCNIEFAQVLAPDRIRMRVWERGTGITEACGSGACATLVAAVRRQLSARRATIVLDGGDLIIEWRDDNHILMIGAASFSFSGVLPEDFGDDTSH